MGGTWDDTFKMILVQNRQERDGMLDLKLKELVDWVGFAYPDRPDMSVAVERARALLTNPFLLSDTDRVYEMGVRIQSLQRDLIVEFRKVDE